MTNSEKIELNTNDISKNINVISKEKIIPELTYVNAKSTSLLFLAIPRIWTNDVFWPNLSMIAMPYKIVVERINIPALDTP
jgi:hypothetical protein